jgi:hypothetical protein
VAPAIPGFVDVVRTVEATRELQHLLVVTPTEIDKRSPLPGLHELGMGVLRTALADGLEFVVPKATGVLLVPEVDKVDNEKVDDVGEIVPEFVRGLELRRL